VKSFGIFEVFQRVWRTGNSEYYPAAIYKDDKDIGSWRENWIYKLPNENIIAIYNDISERVKIDSALRQERDRLESVTRSINAGLVIVSKDYRILWENDFMCQYKGDVNGKLCFATLNELDAPCLDCGVAKIFSGKTSFDSHEYCSTMLDGSKYWVEIIASPIKDENGEVVAFSELAVDITKRKNAECALNQSMNKLVLVNEKLNVVGRLTRHDVRNKLSAVNGFAYLLKKKHADQIDILDDVHKIERAVKDVEAIFEFAKNYEQLGIEELTYIEVEKTLSEAKSLLCGNLDLEVINECQGLSLFADSLLRQLFYNLIDNSVKHGEKVTKIRVHYEKVGEDKLIVVYEDNGVGISVKNRPFLFKEGFSTSNSSGHGLFLIQKMVEVYGWKIEENGVPNKGAKFTITIPKTNQNGKESYQITKL
jgi:PAS domain S-box-containing protein